MRYGGKIEMREVGGVVEGLAMVMAMVVVVGTRLKENILEEEDEEY